MTNNNFNFFRFLFASLVILSHSFEMIDASRDREILTVVFGTLSFGDLAVDGFFLLSGYLIVKSWQSEPLLVPYLKKRVRRIYPGFFVATTVCAFIVGPLGAIPRDYFSHLNFNEFVGSAVLLDRPALPPVFMDQHHRKVNGSLWTISLEFQCYLLVICMAALGAVKRRVMWLGFTGLLVAMMAYKGAGEVYDLPGSWRFGASIVRLAMLFFAGGAFFLFRDRIKFTTMGVYFAGVLVIIGLSMKATAEIALATAGAYVLFYLVFRESKALRFFQTAPDVSYGVYLYGWPIAALLIRYGPSLSPIPAFLVTLPLAIIAGLISWYGVERHFMMKKSKSARTEKLVTGKLDAAGGTGA